MSHFTRRHYEAIAEAIREASTIPDIDNKTLSIVRDRIARTFARDSARFDRDRFIRATLTTEN